MAIEFSRGFPRYRPHDGSAAAGLSRRSFDVGLVIGSVAGIPSDVMAGLGTVPAIVIGPRASDGRLPNARAVIDTAVAGIHEEGTVVRMDDVPLPVRILLDGPPPVRQILADLLDRVRVER
jgi:formylmethanofuran dehydrogenase subunit B